MNSIQTIQTEIENAIQDIHYMDVENISKNIVEYYDDTNIPFIKTKSNSLIRVIYETGMDTEYDEVSHVYNICENKIFKILHDYRRNDVEKAAYTKKIAELKQVGEYKNIDEEDYQLLTDMSLKDLLEHFELAYESNYVDDGGDNNFRIFLEFQHKNLPHIYREFEYIKSDMNSGEIFDETDVERDARFTKFIEMGKTNIPKWIKKL